MERRVSPWGPSNAQGTAPGVSYSIAYSVDHKCHRRALWPWGEFESEVQRVRRNEVPP